MISKDSDKTIDSGGNRSVSFLISEAKYVEQFKPYVIAVMYRNSSHICSGIHSFFVTTSNLGAETELACVA